MPADPTLLDLDALAAAVEGMTPGLYHADPVVTWPRTKREEHSVEIDAPGCVEPIAVCKNAEENNEVNARGLVALANNRDALLARARAASALEQQVDELEAGLRDALDILDEFAGCVLPAERLRLRALLDGTGKAGGR